MERTQVGQGPKSYAQSWAQTPLSTTKKHSISKNLHVH